MIPEAKRIADRRRSSMVRSEERRVRAQAFARELARDLGRSDPEVRAVIGFGSTFEAWRGYRLDSDIDLAFRGGDWGRLWSRIPKSEFSVSLLDLDAQPREFIEGVLRDGVALYER